MEPMPIPGHSGYLVDSGGNVFSDKHRHVGRLKLSSFMLRDGYLYVRLCENNRPQQVAVHRLVLEAFIGPRPAPQYEARHLDANRLNNSPCNLAWGTRQDNIADRELHGHTPRGEAHGCAKLTNAQVAVIRLRLLKGERPAPLAREYGVSVTTTDRINHGKSWTRVRPATEREVLQRLKEGA